MGSAGAGQGVTTARNTLALNRLALVRAPGREHCRHHVVSRRGATGDPGATRPGGGLGLYDLGDAFRGAGRGPAGDVVVLCHAHRIALEEVAATAPGRHFFQIYPMGDRTWMSVIADRAEQAGFAATCVTVDSPVIGRRDRSLESGFAWAVPAEGTESLTRHGFDYAYRATFTWPDLAWLCAHTTLPVILKGVMTADDAIEAVECGVAAVYVSNHGGRMVDQAVSTIEMLAEIVEAVDPAPKWPSTVDSPRGRGVQGACLGGTGGGDRTSSVLGACPRWRRRAGRALEILEQEISSTMANLGCSSIADLTADTVRWSISAGPD